MRKKSYFHLNCLSIIPDCGFQCKTCVNEIRSVLEAKYAVSEVELTELDNISVISVEYDSEMVRIGDMHNELECLPSFYADKFIPQVMDA
jgi:copper chaperone CopZ